MWWLGENGGDGVNYANETAPDLRKDAPRDILQREKLPATRETERWQGDINPKNGTEVFI